MKTQIKIVYGTLLHHGDEYIALCSSPVKLADENGYPIYKKGEMGFLVTNVLDGVTGKHPLYGIEVQLHDAPYIIVVDDAYHAFIFEEPHEIVCVDNSIEEEQEPADLYETAWSIEDILAREE